MSPEQRAIYKTLVGEKVANIHDVLQELTSFEISEDEAAPFLEFHDLVTNPPPSYIRRWRTNPDLEYRYHRFVNGVLGNTRQSYACVKYHQSRIRGIESELFERLKGIDFESVIPPGSCMALGGSEILHFEYQAYVLAYRRCLDQFTWGLTTYFQNECASYNDLGTFLEKQRKSPVSKPLIDVYNKHLSRFSFVISRRKKAAGEIDHHSVRDRISHQEAVPAGVFNINRDGFILVGGGEELNLGTPEIKTLNQVLDVKTKCLHECLAEMLRTFITHAKQVEASLSQSQSNI